MRPGGWGGSQRFCRGSNSVSIFPCFCLHLFLSLTLSLPLFCNPVSGLGAAGAEREVVVNMLNSLSRNQPLPQITSRCGCGDPLPGRLPFQGYESACSGRHYCLRGMDYCATRAPCTERRLRSLCTQQPTVRFAGLLLPWAGSAPNKPRPLSPAAPRLCAPHPSPFPALLCLYTRNHLQPPLSPYWALSFPALRPQGLS